MRVWYNNLRGSDQFSIVVDAVASSICILAAIVNLFVGPFTWRIWAFAAGFFLLANGFTIGFINVLEWQVNNPRDTPFLPSLYGEEFQERFKKIPEQNRSRANVILPLFSLAWLVIALVILAASFAGKLNG